MTTTQEDIAKQAMINWLSHPHELGNSLSEIELASSFTSDGMQYYIFKFKKKSFLGSKWMLGVCGGYEIGASEHCGHVFSDYKEYKPESAKQDAIYIVERIKDYWKLRAESLT